MGQEIRSRHFTHQDFTHFKQCLSAETQLLAQWFADNQFSSRRLVCGYELEAILIDKYARPSPSNQRFLELVDSPLLTPELAQFNIELNSEPTDIKANTLAQLEQNLNEQWDFCQRHAQSINNRLLSIGILPTLTKQDLTLKNISHLQRYSALNEQVLKQRKGEALHLNINGQQSIKNNFSNVMLEAATTSLQIHLQVCQQQSVRYYNAAIIISAPLVAISANSPFLFAKNLWSETRIPLFEQSVNIGGFNGASHGPIQRVSFGTAYARNSLMECFAENQQHFPVLLPMRFDNADSELKHLNLHNGTIWRWNRPLVGFDKDGTPHLRIEHRVISSGPSVVDNVANMAFFLGLIHYYANLDTAAETQLEFAMARDNFYTAAQHGINNKINWPGCQRCSIRHLILHRLLDQAEAGLNAMALDKKDIEYYLGIIQSRAERNQTGSDWQRLFVEKHGASMQQLTQTYYRNQQRGEPVHSWDLNSRS
jgi:gamma-glutamylcysteine synthetase